MRTIRLLVLTAILAIGLILPPSSGWTFPSGKKPPQEETQKKGKEATIEFNKGVDLQKLADSLSRTKDSAKAGSQYKKAAAEYEKAIKLNGAFAEVLSNLGYCRRHLGDFKKSLEAYDRALSLKPDFAQALEYRGMAYVLMGRLDDAKADYEQLKSIDAQMATELGAQIDAAEKGTKPPNSNW
ncbi:MAG: tetratricopeptide repeat protein [candidate division Zixibacteria bacterium]|nr:tetratricopeptide repeat protein [candidate division Zixibacteria bacterium]